MGTDIDDPGFLSRWARRKAQVRDGARLDEQPLSPTAAESAATATAPAVPMPPPAAAPAEAEAEPPPTLADVAELTRESDYSRFVARGVQPDVKNAALKKLFTDPHFNVMDGLDTYIEDYGQPDPLPEGMLRQMVQSHFLGLFADEEPAQAEAQAGAPAGMAATTHETARDASLDAAPDATTVATTVTTTDPAPETAPNEDIDLRLQPDDDARRPGPAPGAGEDPGRQH